MARGDDKAKLIGQLIKTVALLSPVRQDRLWFIVAAELDVEEIRSIILQAKVMLEEQQLSRISRRG